MKYMMSSNGKNRSKSVYFQQRTETKILHLSLLAFTDITLAKTLNKRYACIKNFDFIPKRNYLNRRKIFVEKKVLSNNCKQFSNLFTNTKKYNIRSSRKPFFSQNVNKLTKMPHHNCGESRKILKNRHYEVSKQNYEKKQSTNIQDFKEFKLNFKSDFQIESKKENNYQKFNRRTKFKNNKMGEEIKNKIFNQSNLQLRNIQKMNTLEKINNMKNENNMPSIF